MNENNRENIKSKTKELLAAVFIATLLSSIAVYGIKSVRAKGRDAKRVVNLTELNAAVEYYYNTFGSYPYSGVVAWRDDCKNPKDWIPSIANSAYYSFQLPTECVNGETPIYQYISSSFDYQLSVKIDSPENIAAISTKEKDGACPDDAFQFYTPGFKNIGTCNESR